MMSDSKTRQKSEMFARHEVKTRDRNLNIQRQKTEKPKLNSSVNVPTYAYLFGSPREHMGEIRLSIIVAQSIHQSQTKDE